jgi:hypothetical protein
MFSVSFFLILLSTSSLCYDPKEAPKPRGHSDSHDAHSLPIKPSFSPPRYVSPPLRQSRTPWNPKSYTESISPSRLLSEHSTCKTPSRKNFPNPLETLAYVTPWNSEGYENAKKFVTKFTYISPVWIQIKPNADKQENKNNFILTGIHDVDQGWIKDLRDAAMKNGNRAPLLVPRFAFENWQQQHYMTFSSPISAELTTQIAAGTTLFHFFSLLSSPLLTTSFSQRFESKTLMV